MRDGATSHKTLIYLFGRIHLFLQRLEVYTEIPLAEELTELLGKIMAHLLFILALSTKMTAEKEISELIRSFFYPLADRGSVKFLPVKRLMGRTNVENALQCLDLLTKDYAETNQTLVRVNEQMRVIKAATRTRHRTSRQHCLSVFIYVLTSFSLCVPNNSGGN